MYIISFRYNDIRHDYKFNSLIKALKCYWFYQDNGMNVTLHSCD